MSRMNSIFCSLLKGRDEWMKMVNIMLDRNTGQSRWSGNYTRGVKKAAGAALSEN